MRFLLTLILSSTLLSVEEPAPLSLRAAEVAPGTNLAAPPPVPPGGVLHAPEPTLARGIDAWVAGDSRLAIEELESWLATGKGPYGREKAAGQFLLGWLYLRDGQDNLASAQFTAVRSAKGPLAIYAGWYEALADFRRGRYAVAARECTAYREAYPTGPHAEDCTLLAGHAWVADGQRAPAIALFTEYLDTHPDTPRAEEVRLGLALAEANGNPSRGAAMLADIARNHDYHCNGLAAEAALAELEAKGVQPPAIDPISEAKANALSLRECGFLDEAWDAYRGLAESYPDDSAVTAWVAANADSFAWRTRQYRAIGESMAQSYARSPDPDVAWMAWRAFSRDGDWRRAADWGDIGLSRHATHYQWRQAKDEVAQANLLAGRYPRARELFDELAKGGGTVGRSAKWFGAFASFRAEEYADALSRLDELVAAGGDTAIQARYYRAKTYEAMKQADKSKEDLKFITDEAPESWYGLLARSRLRKKVDPASLPTLRQGRFPGPPPPSDPPPMPQTKVGMPVMARPEARDLEMPRAAEFDWSALLRAPEAPPPQTAVGVTLPAPPSTLPSSYAPNAFYDPEAARKLFKQFSEDNAAIWPELPALYDLAVVGVYEITGPAVAGLYEDWENNRDNSPRGKQLKAINLTKVEWRQIFLFTRDHHHVARFTYGLDRYAATPDDAVLAMRMAFPLVWMEDLETHTRAYDVDPFLALGLIRQESLYRHTALSHVGAVGVMQIMPNTGARVAALLQESTYTPAELEDPSTNVRFGVYYLGRLLTRFEGCWPLAVAAYNAGPVNVSSWYKGWAGRIGTDDFVEQIPLKETRDYVKRVSENYGVYTALYGPTGAVVHVPARPVDDRSEVIDF